MGVRMCCVLSSGVRGQWRHQVTGILLMPLTKSEWSRSGGPAELDVGEALDDLAHGGLDLGPGQAGAEAEVHAAAAEGDVVVRGAGDVEGVGVVEHRRRRGWPTRSR